MDEAVERRLAMTAALTDEALTEERDRWLDSQEENEL